MTKKINNFLKSIFSYTSRSKRIEKKILEEGRVYNDGKPLGYLYGGEEVKLIGENVYGKMDK